MKIRLVGHLGEASMPVGEIGPWVDFKTELSGNSNEIVIGGFGQEIDALVANSYSLESIKECNSNQISIERRVLVLWEPKAVSPKNYSKEVLANYGKIFAPSVQWAQALGAEVFNWPQVDLENCDPNFSNWHQRRNKSVFILANKFSACKGELYSLRRELAFKTQEKDLLDIYGNNWNFGWFYNFIHYLRSLTRTPIMDLSLTSARFITKKFKNYKGVSHNKLQTNFGYRISLVIENSADYISEKLFDSVSSGAITIYVGPNIAKYGLNENSVIQCIPSSREIIKTIEMIQNMPVSAQLKIAKLQFESLQTQSKNWECHFVLKALALKINNYLTLVE